MHKRETPPESAKRQCVSRRAFLKFCAITATSLTGCGESATHSSVPTIADSNQNGNPPGLLSYGSTDPSVIFRSPLTSLASIISPDIGGAAIITEEGTGAIFDPTKGLKPGASDSFAYSNLVKNDLLDSAGQIYFEVETAMLACSNAISEGSSGSVPQSGQEFFLSFAADPYLNGFYSTHCNISSKRLGMATGYGANIGVSAPNYISDAMGKGQFTSIVIAWADGNYYLFVDEVLQGSCSRESTISSPFHSMYIGRYTGGGSNLQTGFMRNLQIANKPPDFPVHPLLTKVQVFGDSYSNATYIYQGPQYNLGKSLVLAGELRKRSIMFGVLDDTQSYGGRKVIGSGDPAVYLQDNISTALANDPTVVIFQAGANDLSTTGSLSSSAFTAAMQTIIQRFFGLNGNPATTVQRMLICTTPWAPSYGSSAAVPDPVTAALKKPDITTIQQTQLGLVSWFNNTYPSLAGRLAVQDVFSDYGGFNPDPTLFGATDLLHPSPKGHYVMGQSWATGLLGLLK